MNRVNYSVEKALECLLTVTKPTGEPGAVPLVQALGLAASQDVRARISQPPFDRSPLDGYALRHEDTQTADDLHPVSLPVTQEIFAGDAPRFPLEPGQAARVMTGAPLPAGTSCVVRQEDVSLDGGNVLVSQSFKQNQNCCPQGEDVEQGQLLFTKGTLLTSAHIGIAAGQGFEELPCRPRPRIGILSTGSELLPPGQPLTPGKIYDSNRHLLLGRLHELGALACDGGMAEDSPEDIAECVKSLLGRCDMVLTTGGVSVGERDHMPLVGNMLGATTLFHGISSKPGGAALALEHQGKLLLCLSGNPFAALAAFELLAVPVIRKLAGRSDVESPQVRGVLRGAFPKASKGRRFIRGRYHGGEVFISPQGHGSGVLLSLANCNCLVDIPAGTPPLRDGDTVKAVFFG